MKLIDSKAEILNQESGLRGIYKQIELAGRTCYKSENKITDESSTDFVQRMIECGHTAMLEHGTVYLKCTNFEWPQIPAIVFDRNPYSKVHHNSNGIYVTTNYRVIRENNLLDCMRFLCEPTEFHERRITLKFTTDRGVSHELVRHRVFSFAQESTRYCNYSKDKFGNELTFIIPSWAGCKDEISYTHYFDVEEREKLQTDFGQSYGGFVHQLSLIEDEYLCQLEYGRTPQEARQILPNALKTEIVMTGFVSDWKHFFDLRLFGITGKPHPDMLLLAEKAKKALEEKDLWRLIYKPN